MFVKAIKDSASFTKQLRTIHRTYGSKEVHKSASSLIVINKDGWLLTAKHVAQNFQLANALNKRYNEYKTDLSSGQLSNDQLKEKYKYRPGMPIQFKNQFYNVFKGTPSKVQFITHETLDLALIHIEGGVEMLTNEYPLFSETEVEPGMMLCKLGYPFSEYTTVAYDEVKDDIRFTQEGHHQSPYFPLEGMVTRKIGNQNGVMGFEMSTPGIKGQSGGPVFDEQGVVYGMQSATRSHDLDLRMKKQIMTQDGPAENTSYAFLNVGIVISSKQIIDFMREKDVTFRSI